MVELHYREAGDGPPLVLLHGLFGSSSNWARSQRALAGTHRAIAVDLRNHGRSPHAASMSYVEMADDVLGLLDRLGLERAALVGHSLGGKVAMSAALRAPRRVERLAVVDIAPRDYAGSQREVLASLQALDLDALGDRAAADAALAGTVEDAGMRAFLLTNLVLQDGAWCWRVNLPAIVAGIAAIEGFPSFDHRYPGATCFIRGDRSDYLVASRDGAAIRRLFPAATIETVADAGHWVHAEQPQAFVALLRRFLDGM